VIGYVAVNFNVVYPSDNTGESESH